MIESKTECSYDIRGTDGKIIGCFTVGVIGNSEQKPLIQIDSSNAKENNEELIQLFEGQTYEYRFEPLYPTLRMRKNIVLSPNNLIRDEGFESGRIITGLYTGKLTLVVEDQDSSQISEVAFEVRSSKLDYRSDYRNMLDYISERCTDLLLDFKAPSTTKLAPDPGSDYQTIGQRFAFLRSILESSEFKESLQRIISYPHVKSTEKQINISISMGFRPSKKTLDQIVRRTPRILLPDNHPLYNHMEGMGIEYPSVPSGLEILQTTESVDTPENRFVKHILNEFIDFLQIMKMRLNKLSHPNKSGLIKDINKTLITLEETISRGFFKSISNPDYLPLGSPVLQKKSGYREILQIWIKFQMAAKLIWHGGDDVYSAGKKDVAVLYEYWVFFRLLELVSSIFRLDVPPVRSIIEATKDGFGLKLKSGRHLAIQGRYTGANRFLRIQFSYNRTFSRTGGIGEANYPEAGSWTRKMRPDYTLSIWPDEYSMDEAEKQELIVHIHFDAKYRAESIASLFGNENDEFFETTSFTDEKVVKRSDLLKMHTYRDAIRRTEGAYVLYPGTVNQKWRGYHEILPGLGAFCLRPDKKNGDLDELSKFIKEVVDHLSDRATRREQKTYHLYKTFQDPTQSHLYADIPEKEMNSSDRAKPAQELLVFIVSCKENKVINWINDNSAFVLPYRMDNGVLPLTSDFIGAKYLLIYSNESESPSVWAISSGGPRITKSEDIIKLGYPALNEKEDLYLIFDISKYMSINSMILKNYTSIIKGSIPISEYVFRNTLDKCFAL